MDTKKERHILDDILQRFQSSSVVKGNKLRSLPPETKKQPAIEQIVEDLVRPEQNLKLIRSLSIPAQLLLQSIATGQEIFHYRELEVQLVLKYGYVYPRKFIRELSYVFLIIPPYNSPAPYRGSMFESSHPEKYSQLWCPTAVRNAAEQLGDIEISDDSWSETNTRRLTVSEPPTVKELRHESLKRACAGHLLQDLFSLLTHLQAKQVKLTAKGAFPRNDHKKIIKKFNFQETLYQDYPRDRRDDDLFSFSYFYFIFALCREQKLIKVVPGRPGEILQVEKVTGLVDQSTEEKIRDLYHLWLMGNFWDEMKRIPELRIDSYCSWGESFVYTSYLNGARAFIINVLTQLGTRQWVPIGHIFKQIRDQGSHFLFGTRLEAYSEIPYGRDRGNKNERVYRKVRERKSGDYFGEKLIIGKDWNKVEGRFIQNVIMEPLHWFGMVNLALKKDGTLLAFQISDLGASILGIEGKKDEQEEQAPCFVVQPNFEIIAYQEEALPDTLWLLAEIAEIVGSQQISQYKLTRDSYYKAREKGYSGEKILTFLHENSKTPIPQNVAYTLKEWESLHEKLKFCYGAAIVELESPELTQELLKKFKVKVIQTLSPTCLQVKPEAVASISSWLKKKKKTPATCPYGKPQPDSIVTGKDMKILLPSSQQNPYLEYKLKQFACSIETTADYHVYQITPDSMKQGKSLGMGRKQILEWLQANNIETVPHDFKVTMENWNKEFRSIGIQKACVIYDSEGKLLDSLAAIEDIAKMIFLVPEYPIALVAEANLDSFRRELEKRNIQLDPEKFPDLFPTAKSKISQDTGKQLFQKYQRKVKKSVKKGRKI